MTGNYFLDQLPPDDRARLMADLKARQVGAGDILIEQGGSVPQVHFPTTAVLFNHTLTAAGRGLQTATVAREGLSGLAPFMAKTTCAWQVRCDLDGEILTLSADRLRALAHDRPTLMHRLLVLTHFYQAQSNQLAVCTAFHKIDSRIARWLLNLQDLSGRDRFVLTQNDIADHLGVQRTSVVGAFRRFKDAGLVNHVRGWLEIADRLALIRHACDCYPRLHEMAIDLEVLPTAAVPARG